MTSLQQIPGNLTGTDLTAAINDRLRRIQLAIGDVETKMITLALNELVLPVLNTLAINSNAAPLVSLPTNGTPTSLVGLIKTAPTGSGVTFQVWAGSTMIGTGTIAAGTTSVTVTTGLVAIPANTVITLAIVAVGSTIPGANLSVMVRF